MTGGVLQRPTLVLNRHWRPVHVTSEYPAAAFSAAARSSPMVPGAIALRSWIRRTSSIASPAPVACANATPAESSVE